jgi:S-layer protein (TIGR01564 family)
VGGGTTGGTYKEAAPITNPVAKFPTEISQTSTLNTDLIVVGGPCANDLAKTLLNTKWNVTDACDQWFADDTLKAGGNGLLSIVEDIFGSGRKALIVAGTNAADTRNLIQNYVIKPTKMATLTGDEYKGTVV